LLFCDGNSAAKMTTFSRWFQILRGLRRIDYYYSNYLLGF
jgi:hypothetical protein